MGLQGTYQEDENVDEDPISAPPTCKTIPQSWEICHLQSLQEAKDQQLRYTHSTSENNVGKYLVDNQNPNFEFDNRAAETEDDKGNGFDSDEDQLYSEDAEGEEADEEL